MKKYIIFFLYTLLATQLCFANEGSIFITDQFKLETKTTTENDAKIPYDIQASYPQLIGNLTPSAAKFNQLVSKLVAQEVLTFKKYVAEDMLHLKKLPDDVNQNSLKIDYDVDVITPADNVIISVRLSIQGMQAGRAHPYHTSQVLNYDLKHKKVLALKDLFKPKSHYLKIISTFSKNHLLQKLKDDQFMIAEGTKPLEKNFKNWSVDEDSIVFTFDEYQVAPYVYGAQEVDVPYTVLKDVIAKDSVIMPCLLDADSCK